jgi:DNA-binding CsgD family transcriptional regulator
MPERRSWPGSPGRLRGRDGELGALRGFLSRTAGSGAALLLTGEPGIGKTTLLDSAAGSATRAGMRVLRATGVEFEAEVAFAGLHQLLLPLQGRLRTLSAGRRDVLAVALGVVPGRAPGGLVLSTAVLELLRSAARDRPVLLAVDDLPRLDRATAGVLGFVARRLPGTRVGFLAASRTGTRTFFDQAGLPELELRPLDRDAAGQLVGDRFPGLAAGVRRRVLDEAQGNPLALVELPGALSGAQREARRPLPRVLPLPRSLEGLFAGRMGGLPPSARRFLLLAALDGTGDPGVLRAASDGRWLDDLGATEEAGLVRLDPGTGRVALRHPLIGAAAVGLSTSGERRRAHGLLAGLPGGDPERRAWHLAEASVGPDEHAAGLLVRAAHRALQKGDAVQAVSGLLRAADLSPRSADRARRLAAAAYVGTDVAGALRGTPELLDEARRVDPEGGGLPAAVAAAAALLHADGDVATAQALLVPAIAGARGDDDGLAGLDDALHVLLLGCAAGGRADAWAAFDAALARSGDGVPALLSVARATFADPARATAADLARLDTLTTGTGGDADPRSAVRTGIAALHLDRLSACRPALWRVVEDGREGGAVASAAVALLLLAQEAFLAGRWEEAERAAVEGIALCAANGYGLLPWSGVSVLALLAAARGDTDGVRRRTGEMVAWAAPRGVRAVEHLAARARGLAALAGGDVEEAYRQASSVSPPGVFAPYAPVALWTAMDLVEAAVRTGRHAEAAAHVAALQRLEAVGRTPRLALQAAAAAALVAPDTDAPDWFERALSVAGAAGCPFELARVRLGYGEHLRRARAVGAAREQLTAAQQGFAELGAAPWAERASHELRATGLARIPAQRAGPGLLTPQEEEIALLAASGLTNKEIGARLYLSPRTVGAHLYRVFPKLGITTRAALRDALTARP